MNNSDKTAQQDDVYGLEPVHTEPEDRGVSLWTARLILFLRVMAAVSMLKGLYHWSQVLGIWAPPGAGFETRSIAWQSTTVFFAIIDLIAAVGLWLAATWGAVVWLASVASMITIDLFFPQIFDGGLLLDFIESTLLLCYILLAIKSAREQTK